MSTVRDLSERERLILQAVVHVYVTTAEPVGSRMIVKRLDLDISPATVRNTMADLEELGYLEQVHTSSGRIPTDQGYRYYVNSLMRVHELTLQERARIEQELSEQLNDCDQVMSHTSALLALISHQTGIVESPAESEARVNRIDLMPVSANRAAVLIADSFGRVRTHMVSTDAPVDYEKLLQIGRFLNENLRGVPVEKLAISLQTRMRVLVDDQRQLADQAFKLLHDVPAHRPGQLYLNGASHLFEQPEFRDVERAREVFNLLEERERIGELLRSAVQGNEPARAAVVFGAETPVRGVNGISVVAAPYSVKEKTVGMIGILGPRRMPYSKMTALVGHTATMLSRLLTRLAG